ncbi:Aquaporin-4 [Rhizophlyctis rosea]|uniref:Aquaporin-4 n=1 Tax=Rhizophlyctis rosea TaxID=64517 RepID=A0AAD5SBL5_9FUNG|nr:Aquaporin-4 [Rhizophlyctis rosea]
MTIRSIKFWVGVYYIIFQISGAVIGAALFQAVVGMQEGQTLGYTLPATGNMGQAFLMEYMITALLIFTVLGTAIHPGASVKPLAPIPIGFAVVVGVIIAGGVTGGSMNPARSIGPAVISNTWEGNWVYWAAPSAAAISVALLYKLVFLSVQVSKEEVDMLANGGDSTATLEGAPDLGAGYRYVSEARAIDAMAADMSLQSVRIDKNRPKVSAPQAQTGGGANGVASTSGRL